MARRNTYRHVIVVDENNVPMVWEDASEQLVYCTDERWQDEHTPLRSYTVLQAKKIIQKTIRNRKSWKMAPGRYRIMPFEVKK